MFLYRQVKADLIYLEHPDVSIISATLFSKLSTIRYELPYLNKLMSASGCLIITTHRLPAEAAVTRNILKQLLKNSDKLAQREWSQNWYPGYYLKAFSGSGSHVKNAIIAAKPIENLNTIKLCEEIRGYDIAFCVAGTISVVLSLLVKPLLYDEESSSHTSLTMILCVGSFLSYLLAETNCKIEKNSLTPVQFFIGGQVAAHVLAVTVNAVTAFPVRM